METFLPRSTFATPASAFASGLGLVILLRELGAAWSGNELLYAVGLAAWLLAYALGVICQDGPRSIGRPVAALFLAVMLPAGLLAARLLLPLLIVNPGTGRGVLTLIISSMLVLAPSGWLAGSVTPCRPIRYALGMSGGGIAASLLPMAGIGSVPGILAAGLGSLIGGLDWRGSWRKAALGLLALLGIAIALSGHIDRKLTAGSHPGLITIRETPRGRLVLTEDVDLGSPVIRLENAVLQRIQDTGPDDLVLLAATQHPDPREAVVLGGLPGGFPEQLIAHGVRRIIHVQQDVEVALLAGLERPREVPIQDLITADPREWLTGSAQRPDLILCALPEPLTVRSNRFWTYQFFALCARRLGDGGILALQMHTSENVWTLPQARRLASVHRALDEVFADVAVLPGAVTVLLAANRPIENDPSLLASRLHRFDPQRRQEFEDVLRRRWYDPRTVEAAGILAAATVPANTDLRPVCLADDLLHDLGRFLPGLGWREAPPPRKWLTSAIVIGALLALLLRRRYGAPLVMVAFYAGLARAVLVCTLLLYHQTQQGTLYRDLGFLLAVAGLGHACGSWLARTRLPGARRGEAPGQSTIGRWRLPVLLVLLSLWSFVVTARILLGSAPAATVLWLAGSGLVAALVLAACMDMRQVAARRLIIADLAGGGWGALLAALLLLPFNGLAATALTVTVLAFPAALSIWPLPGDGKLC